MADNDGEDRESPSTRRGGRRNYTDQIQEVRESTGRMWHRVRILHENTGRLENRVKMMTWGVGALLFLSFGLAGLTVRRHIAHLQEQITTLEEALASPRERLIAGLSTQDQLRKEVLDSVKKLAPELLATVAKDKNGGPSSDTQSSSPAARNDHPGVVTGPTNQAFRVVVGKTDPQQTPWVQYNDGGISVDIDTANAGFAVTPYYFTSLGGHTNNALAQGVTSIYEPTAKGFRVYVNARQLTAAQAKEWGWHINWIAIGE
jgi:hypothetical protein